MEEALPSSLRVSHLQPHQSPQSLKCRLLPQTRTSNGRQKPLLTPPSNLAPGGWIEQLEIDMPILCDDSTLPPDSHLASMGVTTESAGAAAGKPMDVYNTFETWIAEAGFTDIKSCRYKVPIGDWPKLDVYKHAGRVALQQFKSGLEGWMMWLLTRVSSFSPDAGAFWVMSE